MNFSEALEEGKKGRKLKRIGWNGKDQWIAVQFPDSMSKMTQPYFYIRNQQGQVVPWLASQGDLFAEAWCVLAE